MQISTVGSRFSGFHHADHHIASGLLNLGDRVIGVRVFKAPRDFVTFAAVTATYWAVSATISSAILFPLVQGIYETGTLRIALALLSAIGLFVLFNEPLRVLAAGRAPVLKAAVSALAALLGAAAVCYWLDARIFAAIVDAATQHPFDGIGFAANNLVLLIANIMLPALGGGLIIRLARQALRSPR